MTQSTKSSEKVLTEKQVVTSCRAWLKRNGWESFTIYTGGIPTYTGAMVPNPCKGIPDSINFYNDLPITVWIEYKSSIGKLAEEQKEWRDRLLSKGNIWILVNSLSSLKQQVKEILQMWKKEIEDEG